MLSEYSGHMELSDTRESTNKSVSGATQSVRESHEAKTAWQDNVNKDREASTEASSSHASIGRTSPRGGDAAYGCCERCVS